METRSYSDFDAFADDVSSFDGRILLNNPSKPTWSISHVDLGGVHIQIGLVGSGTIVEGESWDGFVVYLPMTGDCRKIINGTKVEKHSSIVMEPGSDIHISSAQEHTWSSIFIPTEVWTRAGNPIELSLGGEKGACRVTRPNPLIAMRGSLLVHNVQLAAATCPEFETTHAARIAAREATDFVAMMVGDRQNGGPHPGGRPRISRQEILRRVYGYFDEREGESISVAELTAATGVCERTLETAFKECFGLTPTRYLQLRHIRNVRRSLRAAKFGDSTVTEILTQHGEYEFGRFAARYRQLYGELPSQTLRGTC